MAFLKRLFGKAEEPKVRVRVCVECGMPVAEHKTWCSILRGELEMQSRAEAKRARRDALVDVDRDRFPRDTANSPN